LSAAPRATLLLEEEPIGLATLSPVLREEDLSLTWGSLVAEELLAVEEELLTLEEELLEEVALERLLF
jgi:hypothetical protein